MSVLASAWSPVAGTLQTRWAGEVDPSCPLPEYPRPQMVRADWLNLNGLWNYGITDAAAEGFEPEGDILVPFAVESSLSGVGRRVGKDRALWYERTFTVPSRWKGKRVLLHFGAVDWQAEVWVNGTRVGAHQGGYTPFSFDITAALSRRGPQTLRVRIYDADDLSWQPRGKQVSLPKGIWYTSVTGIWQTVWLEPVASAHIEDYNVVTDLGASALAVSVDAAAAAGDKVVVELLEDGPGASGAVVCRAEAVDGTARLEVPALHPWSPSDPYLYGLRISLVRGGKVVDAVTGYTAAREVSRVQYQADGKPYNAIGLNGSALFQFGLLDQGWWPDGLYTAPTDEALRFDLEKTVAWGYNLVRKHVKVEPARWYYWCDVLGVMVWQDMPNIGDHSYFRHHGNTGDRGPELEKLMRNAWNTEAPERGGECAVPQSWKDNYYREWGEIIRFARKFPCIVVWTPFNEAWGQFETAEAVAFTRAQVGTRLVNEASGGNYRAAGDILDLHHYPTPAMHAYDFEKINVLGEYGDIALPVEGHTWRSSGWKTARLTQATAEATAVYEDYARMLQVLVRTGCAAAVFTQTTDVENEINGIITYDRAVVKMDEARLRAANRAVIDCLGAFPR